MKNSEENIRQILELLAGSDSYLTLEQLSRKADISRRSVQNYLTKIESWLVDNKLDTISLDKRQGHGIRLEASVADRRQMLQILQSTHLDLKTEKTERRLEIIKSLVFSSDELTIQYLADQFYVSRSAILCDLEWSERWLAKYQLRLFKTQRRGIGVVGNEVSRRNAIVGYFDMLYMDTQTLSVKTSGGDRMSPESRNRLRDIYKDEELGRICTIIEDAEEEFDFFLAEDYYSSLATHVIISVSRIRSGNPVQREFLPPDNGDFPQLEMDTAEFIAQRLEKSFAILLPKSEKLYICIHLMGYNTFNGPITEEKPIPEKIERLAMQIIEAVDNQLRLGFATDKLLFFGLASHLKVALYRFKEDIAATTYPSMGIPDGGEALYVAVRAAAHLYRSVFDASATDSELISLTYHFLLSQKRNTRPRKGLLVCNDGVLGQVELLGRLRAGIPRVEVVDVCSSTHISLCPCAYDFVITTTPIELDGKPVADISHLAKGEDILFLEAFFAEQ